MHRFLSATPVRIAAGLLLSAHAAAGQQAPRPPASAAQMRPSAAWMVDSLPPVFAAPNGTLLRPGIATYDLTIARAEQVTSLGVRTVEVRESTLGGLPAWLIAESRTGSAVATSDSLVVTRSELAPGRWTAVSGRAMLGGSFSHDTLFGALQSYQGRTSFTLATGERAIVTAGMLERLLEMLPLGAGYRASASLVVVELGAPAVQPATMSVERDELLTIGDRAIDCWVVTLRTAQGEQRLWVSKEMPRVVKTEQAFAAGVLTSMLRPPADSRTTAP